MSGHATGAQNGNNMDYSKIMYVAVPGDTMYGVNTVSRPTQYKSGLDYDMLAETVPQESQGTGAPESEHSELC